MHKIVLAGREFSTRSEFVQIESRGSADRRDSNLSTHCRCHFVPCLSEYKRTGGGFEDKPIGLNYYKLYVTLHGPSLFASDI